MDKITNEITDFNNLLFDGFNKECLIKHEIDIINFLNSFDYIKNFSINYEKFGGENYWIGLFYIINIEIEENIYILDKLLGENDLNFIYCKLRDDFFIIGKFALVLKINGKIYYEK